MTSTVLITGSSSGIGRATALLLADKGHRVYATMRNLSKKGDLDLHPGIEVCALDVTDDASVEIAVRTVLEREGKIDVLINNAGYGLIGPMESVTIDQARAQFETNVFGLMRVTRAVLPRMRARRSGRLVNVSSIAGVRGIAGTDLYSASKFAVEGLTESMSPLLRRLGIYAILIQPGPVATEFRASEQFGACPEGFEPYRKDFETLAANRNRRFAEAQRPEEIAAVVLRAIEDEVPDVRYPTGGASSEWVAAEKVDPSGNTYMQQVLALLEGG